MKPRMRITLLLALAAGQGCTHDRALTEPATSTIVADEVGEVAPLYGPWSAPVNLGPAINTAATHDRRTTVSDLMLRVA